MRGYIYNEMAVLNVVGTPSTVLLRRECLDAVGLFDPSLPYCVDYDLWVRISKLFSFECIDEPLVKYLVHADQISNNLPLRITGKELFLQKHAALIAPNPRALGSWYLRLGALCYESGQTARAYRYTLKSIRCNPAHPMSYWLLGMSLLGWHNVQLIKKLLSDRILQRIKVAGETGQCF